MCHSHNTSLLFAKTLRKIGLKICASACVFGHVVCQLASRPGKKRFNEMEQWYVAPRFEKSSRKNIRIVESRTSSYHTRSDTGSLPLYYCALNEPQNPAVHEMHDKRTKTRIMWHTEIWNMDRKELTTELPRTKFGINTIKWTWLLLIGHIDFLQI